MKLKVQREILLKPLQLVSNVVERRQTTPILANALFRVKSGQMTLTGTDLEVEMISHAAVTVLQEGDITLPARKLMDLCKSLPDSAEIEINVEKDKATIRSGRSRFTLATMPAVEFPEIESINSKVTLSLTQQDLRKLIEQTQFAMAQQDVRYYLNGMLFELKSDQITSVATDGHRLACCSLSTQTGVASPLQVIVPRKGVAELHRLLENTQDLVDVEIGTNHLRIKLPQTTFTTKLIDGKFPDYQQVLPKNTTKSLQASRLALHQAFSRIAVLSNEKFRSMRLSLSPNLLKASVHNPEQEEAEEEIEVLYSGEELEIGFNINYFIDALAAIQQDQIVVQFTDSNHSCLVHGLNDTQCKYVIMPMRL